MADWAKVIKGLECCIPMPLRSGLADCENCPYDRKITIDGGITECCHDLMTDALALLKAQEPKKPLHTDRYVRTEPIAFDFKCAVCANGLMRHWTACPVCGRAVKWDA